MGFQGPSSQGLRATGGDSAPATKKVLVPIANGTEEMEAVILIDVLRRAGADVTVASVEPELCIVASRGVRLVADAHIADCQLAFDLIALPGGMPGAQRLRDSEALEALVRKQAGEGRPHAAICAAPAVALAAWGLLADKQATAHPSFVEKLPDSARVEERVVRDGLLTTSRGPGTALEFSLALVEQLYGGAQAAAVAGPIVMRSGDGRETPRQEFNLPAGGAAQGHLHDPPKVLVPIADGSEEMEAVIIVDVLRRAGADVCVASVEEGRPEVTASRGVKIAADALVADISGREFDLIVLPGGMPGAARLRDSAALDEVLARHVAEGRLHAAICAAPAVVLQAKGLLENVKATAHPAFSDKLANQAAVGARVVGDGLVVTSRGPGTALEFALYLVERLFGAQRAAEVAAPMVVPAEMGVAVPA